jgi:hypothetical protein
MRDAAESVRDAAESVRDAVESVRDASDESDGEEWFDHSPAVWGFDGRLLSDGECSLGSGQSTMKTYLARCSSSGGSSCGHEGSSSVSTDDGSSGKARSPPRRVGAGTGVGPRASRLSRGGTFPEWRPVGEVMVASLRHVDADEDGRGVSHVSKVPPVYVRLGCPHCGGEVRVKKRSYASNRNTAIRVHLTRCHRWPWIVPPPRKRCGRKPMGPSKIGPQHMLSRFWGRGVARLTVRTEESGADGTPRVPNALSCRRVPHRVEACSV